jgi:ABC-type uncharacterized transport system substrate-binding protein
MSKPFILRGLSALLLGSLIIATLLFKSTRPRIMIVHSYSPDHPWVHHINQGLMDFVHHWTYYSVSWHYLYADQVSAHEPQHQSHALLTHNFDTIAPDVLLAIDDPAQEWVIQHALHYPHIQIVFAGISVPVAFYGYDKALNVHGIVAFKPLAVVKEMLLTIEKENSFTRPVARLAYLSDPSAAALKELPYIAGFEWQPLHYNATQVAHNYAEWQQWIYQLGQQNDYILVANYRALPRSEQDLSLVTPQEVMRWSELHSPVPVIGLSEFNAKDGAMLALGSSPYEQARVAAHIIQTILTPDKIPQNNAIHISPRFFNNSQYIIAMRQTALKRRNIKLPSIYSTFSTATGNYFD